MKSLFAKTVTVFFFQKSWFLLCYIMFLLCFIVLFCSFLSFFFYLVKITLLQINSSYLKT